MWCWVISPFRIFFSLFNPLLSTLWTAVLFTFKWIYLLVTTLYPSIHTPKSASSLYLNITWLLSVNGHSACTLTQWMTDVAVDLAVGSQCTLFYHDAHASFNRSLNCARSIGDVEAVHSQQAFTLSSLDECHCWRQTVTHRMLLPLMMVTWECQVMYGIRRRHRWINRARQLYKNISMLFLSPVKDGKLSTGVNATFNASCYG